jgi:hypothetical protein
MTSFTEKELLKEITTITLLNVLDEDGFPLFMFVGIKGNNLEKLAKAKNLNEIENIGVIILKGYGYPEQKDWGFMKQKYGIEKDKTKIFQLTNS